MIALVTDSASQIPPGLAERFGVTVVPVTVTVDGVDHREGVDLDADGFWARFDGGGGPDVVTSQPSPGDFAATYRRLADAGAEAVVSIHVGAVHSGTVNSARLGAADSGVDVRVVDSGTASFGVSCCVWEAGEVLAAGGGAEEAGRRAEAVVPTIGTTFIVQALDFARRGGRLAEQLAGDHDGVVVLGGVGGSIEVLGAGRSIGELCDMMVAPFIEQPGPIRAGVCLADPATLAFTEGIESRLEAAPLEVDIVRYRVGPSIAAHTGPGTAGGFWYPIG